MVAVSLKKKKEGGKGRRRGGGGEGGEALATSGLDLDLGRDQLADEVRLERRALRRGLHVLETVDERERAGGEQGELRRDRAGEVVPLLEPLARETELLVRAQALSVTHKPHYSS